MQEAIDVLAALLNLPFVKALSLFASFAGVVIGLLSLRRVNQVADSQLANFKADHLRFLNEQRSRIEVLTLRDAGTATLVAKAFGRNDPDAARREALYCLYLNMLSSAHSAWRNGLIDKAEYEKHMDFFFEDFKGNAKELGVVLSMNYYTAEFDADCRKRLKLVA
jgi:hypothetical protein